MNRITAILLAMAALLVHVFVVHRDGLGAFAPPFDSAHAAYQVARNLAREGVAAWWVQPDGTGVTGSVASYPSLLLVGVAAAFEALSISVTRWAQFVGISCVLLTVLASTRFDTDRIAGVIPAMLLVASGAVAAAGASGTEFPIAMALFVTSFVALEHGRGRISTIALALLTIVRPEGLLCTPVLFVQTVMRKRRPRPGATPPPTLLVFVPAAVTAAVAVALGDIPLIGSMSSLGENVQHGTAQLLDFVVSTASPLLLVFPIVAVLRRELSGVGCRALTLTLTWTAAAVIGGGGPAAYDLAYTPALPMAFIAIQQGMARALDTYRRSMERLVWLAIGAALFGSLFASRFPGNVGQVQTQELHERLYAARATPPPGQVDLLARSSLHSEIRHTVQARRIGTFLRDRLPKDTTILTPWPGALGYLSRVEVIDMFRRTSTIDGGALASWSPSPPALDLRRALTVNADYIVATMGGLDELESGALDALLPESIFRLDPSDSPAMRAEVEEALAKYEIVVTTGEVEDAVRGQGANWARPLVLLRRRGIQAAPVLRVTPKRDDLEVSAGYYSPEGVEDSEAVTHRLPQVFDAIVVSIDANGERVVIDPVGTPQRAGTSRPTLRGIVIDPRWTTPVTLARIPRSSLQGSGAPVRLEARLLHHRAAPERARADAAEPVSAPVR